MTTVVKATPKVETKQEPEFSQSPMNKLLSELKSKHVSGSSDIHSIPPNSGGIIEIPVECEYEYVPHITLQCSDPLNGINICLLQSDNKKSLKVSIENLLEVSRSVRINYFLH